MSGRRILVTGVTSGIGEHTVVELARRGAEVILGARNKTKLDATRKLRSAVLADGPGGSYLVQHSAGSGKTNSIAWTAGTRVFSSSTPARSSTTMPTGVTATAAGAAPTSPITASRPVSRTRPGNPTGVP